MTFQEENDKLLYNILNNIFFKKWKLVENQDYLCHQSYSLELYLTATCNQKCEYCYLQRFKDKLYPKEYDKKDLILHNLEILYQWLIDNNYNALYGIDFFSGEIWHLPFGWEVFDLTLKYLEKGLPFKRITIPTNGSFLLDEETTKTVKQYMNTFKSKYGCELQFSFSIDGPYVDRQVRALNLQSDEDKRTLDFYERIFKFSVDEHLCFHPMLAAKSIKYWCENLDWWVSMCKKYNVYFLERVGILQVRNNDWTEENLKDYVKFIDHYNEFLLKDECKGVVEAFVRKAFTAGGICGGFCTALLETGAQLGCTSPHQLVVRLGDLAIAPCHRSAYDELLYGHFTVENDKITGIKSDNVYTAMKFLTADVNTTLIGCDTCDFKRYCMKQCFGACKEYNNDPFIKCDDVCEMLKTTIYHLVKSYDKAGYYDILKRLQKTEHIFNTDVLDMHLKMREIILNHKEFDKYEYN